MLHNHNFLILQNMGILGSAIGGALGIGIIQTWPTSTAPYIPAPVVVSNDVNDKEKTGVEGVKYDTVANAGAPVNPAIPQAALNQALSPATTKGGATDGYNGSGLSDLIEYLEGKVREFKPLSKEEVEKLRKKQRAEGILSGISDAVQSIANLAATSTIWCTGLTLSMLTTVNSLRRLRLRVSRK